MERSMTFTVRLKPTDEKSKRVIESLSSLDSNMWPTRNAYIIEALDSYRNICENRDSSSDDSISESIRKAVREELQVFFSNLLGNLVFNERTLESRRTAEPVIKETESGINEEATRSENDEFINNLAGVLDRWNED